MNKGWVGMNFEIKAIREKEYPFLKDFLYEAIYLPEGIEPPSKSIINEPELQLYIEDFGRQEGDIGVFAEVEEKPVGMAWVRIMEDFGHIDKKTPSLAISIYKEYRGMGIGERLMVELLREIKDRGYEKTSLSVQKENYAVKLYQKVGYEIVEEKDEEYIMVCYLNR
ncbi:MAG: N-acetyltransferase [Gallicola sp.]|nr:N-acetyltransferase [Gallicola sp.]